MKGQRNVSRLIFFIALTVHIYISLASANNSLHVWHEYRQTQTALTVKYFIKNGWQLDYQTPIVGAPWKVPMEFPTYQTIVYGVHKICNGNLEVEGRITALLFFYLSLLLLYKWMIRSEVTSSSQALTIIAGVLLSSYYLYWASTFLIESTALFFTLWYGYAVYNLVYSKEGNSPMKWALLLLTAIVGMLTKVTVFLPINAVVLLLIGSAVLYKEGIKTAIMKIAIPALAFISAIAIQFLWVSYTDGIKAENPFASEWGSKALSFWTFGSIDQRLTPSFWIQFFKGLGHYQPALYGLILLVAVYNSIKNKTKRWVNLLFLSLFFAGPLIFFNLFKVHTYYSIGNNLFLIIFIFYNIVSLSDTIQQPNIPRLAVNGLVALLIIGLIGLSAYRFTYVGYVDKFETSRQNKNPYSNLSKYITKHTAHDGYIVVCGNEMNSNITYYIDRKTVNTNADAIANDDMHQMIQSRHKDYKFNGIIAIQDADSLTHYAATLWGVSHMPAYKCRINADVEKGTQWLCYYK